ncbi:putative transporter [Candidatus Protochlamydia amoebophila]|uniref:APC family permease n=1 Tax=Candidatus Protochlamydia amoebophila TaxID=362787 RepID=UPI001BCA09AB|nr:APC family permease [Candidatus Protochlamydia amoebophila]MBS4162802.1 putative transporter [Candidatus Protochlamydia amoebophila]
MATNKMGLMSAILLGINMILGSGIFLLPGKVSELTGASSLYVYVFVSLLILSIAWCFAQCAALFDRNGGAYLYAKEAFGDFIGFEIGFMRWIAGAMAWASLIVGFVTALSSIWPNALTEPLRGFLILIFLALLILFNMGGTEKLKNINNVVTIAKVLPLLFFVLIGFFYTKGNFQAIDVSLSHLDAVSFGNAAIVIFYAFGGFETLVIAAGEIKNPHRNLPIAVMAVISFCSFLYFLIQIIAMEILGPHLAESSIPLADATEQLIGPVGRWIITLGMIISIGGVNLTASFITPRSGAALAEDGLVPRWIAKNNKAGVPVVAILLTASLTTIAALSGSFTQLAVISVVSRFVQYGATCLAVFVLYYRSRTTLKMLKKISLIIIPSLSLIGLIWMLFQASFSQLYWGLGALLPGIPIYFFQKRKNNLTLAIVSEMGD